MQGVICQASNMVSKYLLRWSWSKAQNRFVLLYFLRVVLCKAKKSMSDYTQAVNQSIFCINKLLAKKKKICQDIVVS